MKRIFELSNSEKKIKTDTNETQEFLGHILCTCTGKKLKNLKEMEKFLQRYHWPKLLQDQINSLIRPNKVEVVIESLSTKQTNRQTYKNETKGQDGYSVEFYKTFKKSEYKYSSNNSIKQNWEEH